MVSTDDSRVEGSPGICAQWTMIGNPLSRFVCVCLMDELVAVVTKINGASSGGHYTKRARSLDECVAKLVYTRGYAVVEEWTRSSKSRKAEVHVDSESARLWVES